jgi:anhydro-N-acetylmuramic acid kinase
VSVSDHNKVVIGLMSGTSLDGVDVAMVCTDGETISTLGPFKSYPYEHDFRERMRAGFGKTKGLDALEREITERHIQAVERFLQTEGLAREDVSLIGFHGQTVFHEPKDKVTVQLGDGALMAKSLGIDVVNDLRTKDVMAGGQGAPLVPIFHAALTKDMDRPIAVLNLGGVGNVTWIGRNGELLAFDTGPGNALIDDWMQKHKGLSFDEDGLGAMAGEVHDDCVNSFMAHPFFQQTGPKSLDRDEFKRIAFDLVDDLSFEDGLATLTAFTVASVMKAEESFSEPAQMWIVCGGGRLNKSMMSAFRAYLYGGILKAEDVGWNGDAIEAQAFAYLAVRSLRGLPLTFPGTTGVSEPLSGGMFHCAQKK